MAHASPVSPDLRLRVFARDGGCIAPYLGGSVHDCFGRLQLEHVKDELRMGVRAPSDMEHLVTLCSGHCEPGARAGYQWNTDKRNRAAMRTYLDERNGITGRAQLTEIELWHAYRNTVVDDE